MTSRGRGAAPGHVGTYSMAESKALHLLLSWGKEEAKSIQCSHLAAHVAKGKGSSSVVKVGCEGWYVSLTQWRRKQIKVERPMGTC